MAKEPLNDDQVSAPSPKMIKLESLPNLQFKSSRVPFTYGKKESRVLAPFTEARVTTGECRSTKIIKLDTGPVTSSSDKTS